MPLFLGMLTIGVADAHRRSFIPASYWSWLQNGIIRRVGQRALWLDAVAMGVFRQYHVENFGLIATRAVPTPFGGVD